MNLIFFLAQMENDIRDIRGPISVPSIWPWVIGALAVVAMLTFLWVLWRMWLRKTAEKTKRFDELALENLEKLEQLIDVGQVRKFSFAVSDVVRAYVEARFDFAAANRTTEEFLHGVLERPDIPLAEHRALLEDFLRHCDLVKFGQGELTRPQMLQILQSARTFVLATQPPPENEKK